MLIRTRLQIGYVVAFVLAVCVGLAMIWAVVIWQAATADLTASHAQSLRAERLRGDLYRQVKEILDRFVSGDRAARQEFEHLGTGVERSLRELRAHAASREEAALIDDVEVAHRRVSRLVRETFSLLGSGARARAMQKVEHELEQVAFREQDDRINRLRAYYDAASDRSRRRTVAVGRRGTLLAATVMVLALLWGGGLLFGIQRWLVRPLQTVGRSTAVMSTGDLDHRIQVASMDELGDLARSINGMAQALKQIQERLVQAERLAAIGELSSYIAHNIRNPLASIRSSAQAALDEPGMPSDVRAHVASIIKTVDHLNQWVHHFLFVFKPITPALAPGDVNRIVRDAVHVMRPTAERKGVELQLALAPGLPPVPLDAGYLEQAIVSILMNACDAASPGTVLIGSRLVRDGAGVQMVAIDVADSGAGIPHELRQQVFTPFFTTKPGGVGLGLTMAQKIVAAHGGTVALSSRDGGGTTVRISLPVSHRGLNDPAPPPAPPGGPGEDEGGPERWPGS
jgi:signal transduction histidine kinase